VVIFSRQTITTTEEPALMHDNLSVLSKQHRVQRYAVNNDTLSTFNQLTSPDLLNRLESLLPKHRERYSHQQRYFQCLLHKP
jgi:hypothetical protein